MILMKQPGDKFTGFIKWKHDYAGKMEIEFIEIIFEERHKGIAKFAIEKTISIVQSLMDF